MLLKMGRIAMHLLDGMSPSQTTVKSYDFPSILTVVDLYLIDV